MSINQMAEFVAASERGKRAIVRKQKHPSTFRVARYATARASFKNYCKNDFDEAILLQGLEKLQNKTPVSQWAASEKSCSIQAIRGFMQSHFPERFGRIKCSFFTPREKQIRFGGLTLVVAPDLIFRWEEDGTRYIGCLKLRIKQKAAELEQEYQQHLQSIRDERDTLLREATARAQKREEEIVGEARAEAAALRAAAEADIAQERKKAVNDLKNEIGGIAVDIAGKVVEREINETDHKALIDEFIRNVGDAS